MSESHVIPNPALREAMVPADNTSSHAGDGRDDLRDVGPAGRDEVNAVSAADGTTGGSANVDTGAGRAGGAACGSAAGNAAGSSGGLAGSGPAGTGPAPTPATDGADGGSGRDDAADGAGALGGGVVPQNPSQQGAELQDTVHQDTADQDTADQDTADRNALAGSDAASVRRGIQRMFARYDVWLLPEMPLRNGRRADLMGVDSKGRVIIIEIKVQRGDLLGDGKWQDYLDYCDRFYWGVCPDIDRTVLDREIFRPDCCGIVVADGYDGEIVRPASLKPLAPARRKAETERLARAALRRMTVAMDPHCTTWGNGE